MRMAWQHFVGKYLIGLCWAIYWAFLAAAAERNIASNFGSVQTLSHSRETRQQHVSFTKPKLIFVTKIQMRMRKPFKQKTLKQILFL